LAVPAAAAIAPIPHTSCPGGLPLSLPLVTALAAPIVAAPGTLRALRRDLVVRPTRWVGFEPESGLPQAIGVGVQSPDMDRHQLPAVAALVGGDHRGGLAGELRQRHVSHAQGELHRSLAAVLVA